MGVEHSRLRTISYGKDNPLVAGDTEEVYAQNRAAVTTIE
jgi:peptidoglycan-associated lipoprotein